MTASKLNQFGGMLPAWDPKLLPEGQSANSVNGYMFSGALQGWRAPKFLRSLTNGQAAYAYRIPKITTDANGVDHFDNTITRRLDMAGVWGHRHQCRSLTGGQ